VKLTVDIEVTFDANALYKRDELDRALLINYRNLRDEIERAVLGCDGIEYVAGVEVTDVNVFVRGPGLDPATQLPSLPL
jgi:hypothetical protein